VKKLFILLLCLCVTACGKKEETQEEKVEAPPKEKNISVIDVNSKTRPYAIVVNNSTVAVKVQEGLQEAYLVYEIPVEGNLTRLLALYKDAKDITIGTIRSARHNFLDYALESDAIFVCYGWSHYAKKDMQNGIIDYINGVVNSTAFWRANPENLATEHTAYTSINKLKEYTVNHNIRTTTESGLVLDYSTEETSLQEENGALKANHISISAGGELTEYDYDEASKKYKRKVNNNANIDHASKNQLTVKNIIVQKITTKMAKDNYYWDLETTGSGEGYFITNGYAIPIKWKKATRNAKTEYLDASGEKIKLNDGNTFIQLQDKERTLKIN